MKTSNKIEFKQNCDPGAQKQSSVAGYTVFVAIDNSMGQNYRFFFYAKNH